MQTTFALPKGMEPEQVAQTLAAYLLGWRTFTNFVSATGQHRLGPYATGPGQWQLDPSNDYVLNIEDDVVRLSCRHEPQARTIETMKTLFTCRFDR